MRPAAPGRTGIFTDFDGTLSAIVDDPAAARPLPGVVDALSTLAVRYRRVAVISGRPVAFLSQHLGAADGVLLCGLYGLERVEGGRPITVPGAEDWRAAVQGAGHRASAEAPSGVHVEDKGLALTIHFRTATDEAAAWARAWAEAEAARSGLAVHAARRSVELRPPVQTDKGTVVAELAAGLEAAYFLGDDIGDLPAFEAVHAMGNGTAVVVGSDECPSELLQVADVVVDGPEGALDFLHSLP